MKFVDRAYIPVEAMGIMAARTLANSHPTLLGLLRPGMSVLDVGCGPGTLTAEVARRVDPGHVVGMDVNPEMVRAAEEAHPPCRTPNVVFYTGDIRESCWDGEFDLVNATRVLQWIPDCGAALCRMAHAAASRGPVVVRDYDHTQAEWSDPPAAWITFYRAFLAWREAGGLDNAIATRLPALCRAAGLEDARLVPQITTVRASDADFFRVAGLWRLVIESRGRQMVAAGYITEPDRRAALDAFTDWMREEDASQTVHEACIVAHRP
ncbi:MAG: ubiquinone biosynthesis methyltransferase UbiE [Candidatus Rokuibacteriota bacterium]|nr:MAG: ubiquinone biosynthesis methyltransferase UbiE [Candidatus Rokubacteria bacterium]